jgi:hypothetical protein
VYESDWCCFIEGENQPLRIEVGLREDELLENAGRDRLHQPALRRLFAPDLGDPRRVGITKRPEVIHGAG